MEFFDICEEESPMDFVRLGKEVATFNIFRSNEARRSNVWTMRDKNNFNVGFKGRKIMYRHTNV